MRFDDVAPRTLVLGALAAWALAAWALALAGMGGRLPGPGSGTIPAPPLPATPRTAAPALGGLGQYDAISARPLFATDRRPHPFSLQPTGGAPAEAPEFDLVLTSVLMTPQANLAIVQKPDGSAAWRVRMGDSPEAYPNWRLSSIAPRSATFTGPEGEKTLELRVYAGQAGASPAGAGMPGTTKTTEMPGGMPVPIPAPPPPPPTDAGATPDPEQIEAIRRRIEARREQMRQRAQNANPPSSAQPAPPSR